MEMSQVLQTAEPTYLGEKKKQNKTSKQEKVVAWGEPQKRVG